VLDAVGEGVGFEGLEHGLVGGGIAAGGEPGAEEPVEGAELEVGGAFDLDLGDEGGGEGGNAYFAHGLDGVGDFEADVVAAVFEGDDLGIVPLVPEPLATGEATSFGPGEESGGGGLDVIAFIGAVDADIGDAARREEA